MKNLKWRIWLKPEHWDPEENRGLMTNGMPLDGMDGWWLNFNPGDATGALDGSFIRDQIEILLFTGWTGRGDVEIYEGDIIEFRGNYTQIQRCGDKKGYVVWSGEEGRFQIKVPGIEEPYDPIEETDGSPRRWKVLGNIYENPELLI